MPLPLLPILAGALFAFAWGSKKKGEGSSDAYVPAGYQPQQWQANPIVRGAEGEQVVRAEVVPTMLGVLEGATPVPPGGALRNALVADRVELVMPGAGARAWAQAQAAAGRAVLIRTDPHATGELWAVPPLQVATVAADGAPWAVLLRPGAGGLYPPPPYPSPGPLPPLPPIPGAPAGGVPGIDLVPEPQRTQLGGWLANPLVTPAQLRQLAAGFPGNPALVGWLEARAKELEQAPAQQVASGHTYTLRKGAQDNASALAKHFTGDAGRWREILAVNPKMEPYTEEVLDASGSPLVVTKIRPWVAGQVIQLPASWDLSKGPPPMVASSPKAKAAPAPIPNASNMPPEGGDFDR